MNVGQAGLSYLKISYYTDFGATVYAQGYGHNTSVTAFAADLDGGAPLPVPHSDPFVTFCLDINNYLANGWWQSGGFADTPLNNDSSPADRQESGLYRAASLYAAYAGGIMNVGGSFAAQTGTSYDGIYTAREKGAALQLAIWEVLYEKSGSYSINENGSVANADEFYVSSVALDIRNLANTMLASAANNEDLSIASTFWNAVKPDGTYRSSQDLIGPMAGTSIAVPEPATMIAGALLLLPFGASTVRILRKNRAA